MWRQLPQALFECLKLRLQLIGEPVPEAGQMLLDLRQLRHEGLGVDLEEQPHVVGAHLGPLSVDLALCRDAADRGVDGLAVAITAAEYPFEDPDVVPEAGP